MPHKTSQCQAVAESDAISLLWRAIDAFKLS